MPEYKFCHFNVKPIITEFRKESDYIDTDCEIIISHKANVNGRPSIRNINIGRSDYASRVFWEYFNGPIIDNLYVLHKCHNKTCININHLYLGTHQDNVRDAVDAKRVRGGSSKGSTNKASKLTEKDIMDIKELLNKGMFQAKIANIYGVSQVCISLIKRNKSWTHV